MRGIRLRKLKLFGTISNQRTYEVSFLDGPDSDASWRSISIIAGASATGKTSVVDYVRYLLGDAEYPDHDEMKDNVSSAALEVELSGVVHTIQRNTIGAPSKFASVWRAPLGGIRDALEERYQIDKPGDADSLSNFLLTTVGLGGARLQVSPSKADSDTHALSIRDLFRVVFFTNSRLDSENLLLENGNPVVALKLQQTIDLMLEVSDDEVGRAQQQLRDAEGALREAEATLRNLTLIVDKEYPLGPSGVAIQLEQGVESRSTLRERLRTLDANVVAQAGAVDSLRLRFRQLQASERESADRVRARQSLIERLRALSLQYTDDKRKLVFLTQAEKVFDPLHVIRCPACMSRLAETPRVVDDLCTLCGSDTAATESVGSAVAERELRAVSRRLDELTGYLDRLQRELRTFIDDADAQRVAASSAATEVQNAALLPAPYLAYRDQLSRELSEVEALVAHADLGVRLWSRVQDAQELRDTRQGAVERLRRHRRELSHRPDRSRVVRELSDRFASILAAFGYPKLSDAYLDDRLIPHVRGAIYTKASSGGLVLITLAWAMALWEITWEREGSAPGLLVIDSPQKNLGHRASSDDPDFADAQLVTNVYAHVQAWLRSAGQGAQILFVDNSPPVEVDTHVIARYSGRADKPPFGLIDNAID